MRATKRVTTLLLLLLTALSVSAAGAARDRSAAGAAQDSPKNTPYEDEMRKADLAATRHLYEPALQSYKKAFALSDKASLDALFGMMVAYRGLGAHKNVLDLCDDAMKLAGEDTRQQAKVHNLKGSSLVALVSLADKPNDKRLDEALDAFRAAIAANPDLYSAQLNLGVTLLKQRKDEEGIRELNAYLERAPRGPDTENVVKMVADPRRARESFAPDFSFTTRDGAFVSLEDLKGKVVVLDFWGTWCHPCVVAAPGLVRLNKKYGEQGVTFVSVAENDREEAWAAFIDKNKMEWPQFFDKTRKMVVPYNVTGFPTYIVIDGDGIVRAKKMGYGSDTDHWLDNAIKQALKRSTGSDK
jgi:thiol-disulfide isomerase/thioredoxin